MNFEANCDDDAFGAWQPAQLDGPWIGNVRPGCVPPGVKSVDAVVAAPSWFDTVTQSASSAQRALPMHAKKNSIAANRKRNGMWKGMTRDSISRVALSDTDARRDSRHSIFVAANSSCGRPIALRA
jgi:hypothetical protein